MLNAIRFWIYDYSNLDKPVERRHAEVVVGMNSLQSPLRIDRGAISQTPQRERGSLASFFTFKYPGTDIVFDGAYLIRDRKFLYDSQACDDKFSVFIPKEVARIQYDVLLQRYFPEMVAAIGGYRAAVYLDSYASEYDHLHQSDLHRLRDLNGIDVNGRNNIFTLQPAQYWDAELCQRALGYGPDEVIRRLSGKVPLVKPLMDGVYVVFNDNPDLTFEEFCAYNDRLKPVLGLA